MTAPAEPDTPAPQAIAVEWGWPVAPEDRSRVTGGFGEYLPGNMTARYHAGIDIGLPRGPGGNTLPASAVAAANGHVVFVQKNDLGCVPPPAVAGDCSDHGLGNTVIMRHQLPSGEVLHSQYSHLAAIDGDLETTCRGSQPPAEYYVCSTPVLRNKGQTLGSVGSSAYGDPNMVSTHLHFEMKRNPGIGTDLGGGGSWGYSTGLPRGHANVIDPFFILHSATQINAPLVVNASVHVRMGPSGLYPRTTAITPAGAPYEVLARVSNAECSGEWSLVRRIDGRRFVYLGSEPGIIRARSEFPDGWVCGDQVVQRPAGIYVVSASSGSGPTGLYLVDPRDDGNDSFVGIVRTSTGPVPTLLDIAEAPTGTLYAIGGNRLFRIASATAEATEVGFLGLSGNEHTNAMAFDGAGRLIAMTTRGAVLKVDLFNGQAASIGQLGGSYGSSGDLVFMPNGVALAVVSRLGDDQLVRLDPMNGFRAEVLPGEGRLGFSNVWGLSYYDGTLYGLASPWFSDTGRLFEVDPLRGTLVRIVRSLGFLPYGAAPPMTP
jgi:murein DD-endopeptidase MepM/ murein hydrolase activator NlpD